MIEQVAAAFERKDYKTAAGLLKQLVKQEPQNLRVQLYVGRLHEVTGKLEAAQTVYRKLLRDTANEKIMAQARQGLGRVEAIEQQRRQQALDKAKADPRNALPGFLVLEQISTEAKTVAAQKFARIMQLDPYIARLHLPSRGWRLYRTGSVGEMGFYGQQLLQAEIPCLWATLADIQKINVFRVNYFSEGSDAGTTATPTAVCQNELGQTGSLSFAWSEVKARVEGLLPIFEEVADMDVRRKMQRKTKTLDYAQFCDLHLPGRNSILRLGDRDYEFQQGVTFAPKLENGKKGGILSLHQTTTRTNWNNLLHFLAQQMPHTPVWSDFTTFAETSLEQVTMLGRFKSHIDLSRLEQNPWDSAFHLYSGLIFLKKISL